MISKLKRMTAITALCTVVLPAMLQAEERVARGTGYVTPTRSWDIAPVIDGQIEKLHFVEGDIVAKGDLLVELVDDFRRLELERVQSLLDIQRAELQQLEDDLERMQELREREAVAEASYLDAEFAVEAAKLLVKTAEIDVKRAEAELAATRLTAPANGIISAPRLNERANFNVVESGSIATVAQLDPIDVRVAVDLEWVLRELKRGTYSAEELRRIPVALSLPDGTPYQEMGHLSGIGNDINRETGEGTLIIEFPNPKGVLRPGLRVVIARADR
ncbi:efflux RND transporter periplasmic adaptor subunit [Shimia sp. W99]